MRFFSSLFPLFYGWVAVGVMAIFSLAGIPFATQAAEIIIPLTVHFDLLTQEFARQVYTGPGGVAAVWDEGECRHLSLDHPQFSRQGTQVRFTTHGAGSFGTEVLGKCLSPFNWRGFIEVLTTPYVTADWQLRLRIVESNLYDEEWKKGLLTGLLWEVTERVFLPRLTDLTIDLAPPRDDVLFLVRTAVPPSEATQVEAILRSAAANTVEVHDAAIVVPLALTVPDTFVQTPPLPTHPEAPLSAAELAVVHQSLEQLDAFLVFVIKGVGADVGDPQVRAELFDLLLTSRYELLRALTDEVTRGEGDPVRRLFVETWKRLHDIIQRAEQRGLLKDKILRYAGFISAGDALMALDQATPGLGIDISADGLRRLARMLRPDAVEDPLAYSPDVDPTLRTLFGLSPELPVKDPDEVPPTSEPHSSLGWLGVAYAATSAPQEVALLKKRLDRWVPQESEFAEYCPAMAQLLRLTIDQALQNASLEARYVPLCRTMMSATALQESCWQQFERDNEKIVPRTSAAGSIGLMQINRRVWRGFYEVEQLKWNTVYNARAGAEILLHYLQQYGVAEAKQTGNLDNAARATYAVYNAGPKAVTRYRARNSSSREKKVDARFRNLYRGFAANGQVDLSRCTVEKTAEQ
jgi:hypothetical protein